MWLKRLGHKRPWNFTLSVGTSFGTLRHHVRGLPEAGVRWKAHNIQRGPLKVLWQSQLTSSLPSPGASYVSGEADSSSQQFELPFSFLSLPSWGPRLVSHSCSALSWFMNRRIHELKIKLEDKTQTGREYLQKTNLMKTVIQNMQRTLALTQLLSGLEHYPVHQKALGFNPWSGIVQEATCWCFTLTWIFFLSLFLSL